MSPSLPPPPPLAPPRPSPLATELEIKLLLPPGAEAALRTHALLHPPGAPVPKRQYQVTTYFDTPAWDLAHMGASLRIRRRGGKRVQTLKLRDPSGQAFERGEWEWPVEADAPDRALLAATPIATLLAGMAPFAPVFATEIDRSLHLLDLGGSSIEVALDQGRVRAGAAAEPILELELELKAGSAAPLYRLAAELQAALPLRLGSESKAERGWRLATGQPRAAVKLLPPLLPRDISAAEAWRRIIGATLANLLANLPAAMAGHAEGIRQLRAATRRLRSALALFRPVLAPEPVKRFGAELQRLGRVLGKVRDWDVFCTETLAATPGGAPLRAVAEVARAAAHRDLTAEFAGPGLTATVLGLAAWAEASDGPEGRLAELLPVLEARLARRVRRRGRHIRRQGPEALHDLRKALKTLRHGVEFMAPLHRRKPVHAWLAACAVPLARLGMLNDAVVAVALAARLGGPGQAALAEWAESRQAAALHRLPEAWQAFKAVPLPG